MVGEGAAVPWLKSRTLRSFEKIRALQELVVVVRVGSWLRRSGDPSRLRDWGRNVISVGLDRSDWSLGLVRRFGGDFGRRKGWRSPFDRLPPVCVFPMESGLAGWGEEAVERVALEVLRSGRWRVVHVPELDVGVDDRMRVVQWVTTVQRGGAERVAVDLAERLSGEGCASLLVNWGRAQREAYVPRCDWVDLSGVGDRQDALEIILGNFGADLVHAHLLSRDQLRWLKERGVKVVTTLHNVRQAWPAGVEALGRGDVDLCVACSKAVESQMEGEVSVRTVWNGVGTPEPQESRDSWRRRLGVGEEDLVLMALANVRPQKNLEMLPRIWAEVQRRCGVGRVCHLWLAGEGTLERQWPEGVRALGCIRDTAGFLRAGDVLVCPSHHEGLSLAQLEALAAGTPVVATRVGGTAEVGGITPVEPGATEEVFARAILAVVEGEAPGFPESFRVETMVSRHRWLYEWVLRGGGWGKGLWLVTNHLGTGGAQTSAIRLVMALKEMGCDVRVAVVEEVLEHPSAGTKRLRDRGLKVWSLAAADAESGDVWTTCGGLLREMAQVGGRTVFFWNLRPVCKLVLADALMGCRIWDVSPGEMNFDSLVRYMEKPLAGWPYESGRDYGRRLAGAVVKYSAEKERAKEFLGCRVEVIPNGVPSLPRREAVNNGSMSFVTVARLSPDKKLEELIQAWVGVESKLPGDVWLHVAGGEDGEKNEAYARALRKGSEGLRIRWHGHVEDVPAFLGSKDVFVMISEPAGCPNAGLEALSCGLPMIATDHGGASDQVIDDWNGFLVSRGDVVKLGDCMLRLASDASLRREMGARSLRLAEDRFGMARMVDSYLRLIEEAGVEGPPVSEGRADPEWEGSAGVGSGQDTSNHVAGDVRQTIVAS